MESSYLRCGHCRGFYEIALSRCRYCGKDVPLREAGGSETIFTDRAMCRAIQIAEFEQLPAEAHADPFRPDPELLAKPCYCLHCGLAAGFFEAVEMRWMANEGMWACPCTTCGGRGFTFDIHPAEQTWKCAACGHRYSPADDDFRFSNVHCPKCGCGEASGWFEDEEEDEELPEEMMAEGEVMIGDEESDGGERLSGGLPQELMPWEDDDEGGAVPFEMERREPEKMQDDIDFPRERREPRAGSGDEIKEDDIPW